MADYRALTTKWLQQNNIWMSQISAETIPLEILDKDSKKKIGNIVLMQLLTEKKNKVQANESGLASLSTYLLRKTYDDNKIQTIESKTRNSSKRKIENSEKKKRTKKHKVQ